MGSVTYSLIIMYMKLHDIDTSTYTDNLQIGSVFFIVLFFIIIKQISETIFANKYLNQTAAIIAQYSFGIYLLHIYVVRDGVWVIMENFRIYNHPILETSLVATISMALCVVIMKLLSAIYHPFGKWLFGLK